ncbi:N-acetyl sugar amidotransferase [Magnetovibrio sp. PR-2]|uniref:N-acetyl sugar amidotransferase n=1 Tax=Magnetovibrio sp. PR-2 TaxID=3120356 RepID=UPI002FCE3504
MKYCRRCLYPENHPLTIMFDDEGVCSGCRVHEEKDSLDWQERRQLLARIFDEYRCNDGRNYDCIVPVSGARDSYFIVHTVKNLFGMRPLLVSYNRQYNTELGIRNLAYLRTKFDCDYLESTASPEMVKRVVRETLHQMGSFHWHAIAGQTAFPVQVATQMKIPLIVWGVHQGCDQVGMYSHLDEVEMTRKYRAEHDLMGFEAEDLVGKTQQLTESDLQPFLYPHNSELSAVGVRGIYLSNYIRWDSKQQHEDMIELFDYETAAQLRTFDTYNDVNCHHYSGLHDHIKHVKWGYSKVVDHAVREIRLKRLTRAEGLELVKRYQDIQPTDKTLFLDWLGMPFEEFDACIEAVRSNAVWTQNDQGDWVKKECVTHQDSDPRGNEVALDKTDDCEFVITPSKRPKYDDIQYRLMSRGHL